MDCIHQKVFHMNEKKKHCLTARNIDIDIPTFDINTLDFSLSQEKKKKLFNSGYNAAKEFLDKWNFNIYVENYRNN